MFHSVYFGDKNTWDDYGLVPVNKIYIPIAKQKVSTIEIEGASGSLDLSTYLTGYPIYSAISGAFDFLLMDPWDFKVYTKNEYPYPENYNFYDIFTKLYEDLDGKECKIWLEDDPDWYYEGRINVQASMAKPRPRVVVNYTVNPYKLSKQTKTYVINGLGSMINRQVISEAVTGSMPANFKMIVGGGQASVQFICEALNVNEERTFEPGTYEEFDWIIYKKSEIRVAAPTTVSVKVEYVPGRL